MKRTCLSHLKLVTGFIVNFCLMDNLFRVLEEGDFASDFHVFGLQRLPQSIRFYVDGILIGEITPPDGGFWEVGQLDRDPGGPNIWANGTTMTPFDYPVNFQIVICF